MTLIIGVDPGQTTGVAVYSRQRRQVEEFRVGHPRHEVLRIWSILEDVKDAAVAAAVAMERYDIESGTVAKTRQYDALHVAGAVKYKCIELNLDYFEYSRADAKNFATDDKLRQLEMYTLSPHSRDAARQVLIHLAEVGEFPVEKINLGVR